MGDAHRKGLHKTRCHRSGQPINTADDMVFVERLDLLHHGLHAIEEFHVTIGVVTSVIEILGRIAGPSSKTYPGTLGSSHKAQARLINQGVALVVPQGPAKGLLLSGNQFIGHLPTNQMAAIAGEDLQVEILAGEFTKEEGHVFIALRNDGNGRYAHPIEPNRLRGHNVVVKNLKPAGTHHVGQPEGLVLRKPLKCLA